MNWNPGHGNIRIFGQLDHDVSCRNPRVQVKMSTSTKKVLCRYYMSGCCMKGNQCTFSHEWTDKPDMTCRFYLKGQCVYGESCRYDHVKPKESGSTEEKKKSKKVAAPVSLPTLASSSAATSNELTATQPKLVPLRKDPSKSPRKWALATEFVPGRKYHRREGEEEVEKDEQEESLATGYRESYSDVASGGMHMGSASAGMRMGALEFLDIITPEEASTLLCPFAEMGVCPFGETCEYLHGDVCDMCNRQCLNPFDPEQQKAHRKECLEMHEREMEKAFQVQESEGKTCGVCMEQVMAKLMRSERRFGIMSNCEHCFCLACIRKWRGSTHTGKKTIRACPVCRRVSYFVIPSQVWVEDQDQKHKLMEEYKSNLSKKHCKYFNMGNGTCPFGGSCFYRHEYPDGTKANIAPRICSDAEGRSKVIRNTALWDFVQEREDRSSYLSEDDDDELSSLGLPFALRLAILDGSAESWSDDDLYDSD